MEAFKNCGCLFIGWDKNILKECGEASYRQYRKLLSAICIMMGLLVNWIVSRRESS